MSIKSKKTAIALVANATAFVAIYRYIAETDREYKAALKSYSELKRNYCGALGELAIAKGHLAEIDTAFKVLSPEMHESYKKYSMYQ